MDEKVYIFTDGSCMGNPGPGGWAALLKYQGTEKTISGCEGDTTNNRMELTAPIEALNSLTRKCDVILSTDSRYVKDGITSWIENWQKNNWKTASKKPVQNVDLWKKLLEASKKHNVKWEWVKAHAGHTENELVDRLAKEAIKKL